MQSGNPALKNDAFAPREWGGIMQDLQRAETKSRPGVMTLQGTVIKTGILVGLCAITALVAGNAIKAGGNPVPWLLAGLIGTLVVGLVLFFSSKLAPVLAPVYAVLQGASLGAISLLTVERLGPGNELLITQALALTFGVFIAMLGCYMTGLLRATPLFTKMIVIGTLGVMLTYLASMVLGLFGITILAPLHGSGMIGIGFSLLVVGLAAFNLILDFDMVENGVRNGAPKYMEWYAGYALLVTLVWLYIELLRLLAKLNSRK